MGALPMRLPPFECSEQRDGFAFRDHNRSGEESATLSREGKLELTEEPMVVKPWLREFQKGAQDPVNLCATSAPGETFADRHGRSGSET
jgi:hypothetical protein